MVPAERAWLFWDVDPDEIEVERDARYVTSRVLEHGRLADVRWLVEQYGLEGIRAFFENGGHPELSGPTLSLWRAVFDVAGGAWPTQPSWRTSSAAPWID
jgi:hypothetical protein